MKWIIAYIFIVAFSLCWCTAKKLPSFIQRCKRTDPLPVLSKCVAQRAEDLKPYLIKGIPEMKLPSIDPLHISKLEIDTGNEASVGFHAIFSDVDVYGVKDFEIKEVIFDLKKPYILLHLYIPNLYIQTTYSFKGKILLFELNSTGKGYMNLTDIYAKTHHRNLSIVKRNKKEYLNLEDDEIEYIKFTKGSVYFENMFPNNEQLTEQTNKALNENFGELEKELSPLIYKSIRLLLLGTIKPVFDDYSLDELFE